MMRVAAGLAAVALVLGCLSTQLHAQAPTPSELLSRGLQAYDDLEFDAAAGLLRSAVGAGALSNLPPQRQAEILTYFGAAERFRGNVDSTFAVFRQIVVRFPRYQIDELIFPPEVTNLFAVVRRRTPAVELRLPDQQTIQFEPGQGRLTLWAYPSTTHTVSVHVLTGDGRPVRTIHTGPISDSLEIRWNGRDARGSVVPSGGYVLTVESRGAGGNPERLVQVPLDIEALSVDTVALPIAPLDSMYLPDRRAPGPGLEALVGGVLTGVAVAVVPSIISSDAKPSGTRFAVGVALSAAGVAAFFQRRPGGLLADNVAFNDSVRQAWQDSVAVITTVNADRRRAPALVIRIGTLSRVELGG